MSDPVTSAQEAAVDAMTEAARGHVGHFDDGDVRWVCECAKASGHDLDSYVRHVNRVALAVLLSPTKKPCATCEARGWLPPRSGFGVPDECPDCTDGFVLSPPPIEGLGWVKVSER